MFESFTQLMEIVLKTDKNLFEIIIEEEIVVTGKSRETILERGQHALDVMRTSLEKGNTLDINLPIEESVEQSQLMLSRPIFLSRDMKEAVYSSMSIMEYSNGMGIICAAPTAGSSGIIPATLFKAQQMLKASDQQVLEAYFVAATIGAIIGNNATLSGAEGGCQAEVGVASAMAASAMVYLAGGDIEQIIEAVPLALKNTMGLVCDPVAGLVIDPCIQRNAIGVMNAFLAAEMALSGVSAIIPADEVVEAMKKVGIQLPTTLKETGKGGIAATPTGKKIRDQIFTKKHKLEN